MIQPVQWRFDANKKNFQVAFDGWVNPIQSGVLQLAPPLKLCGELQQVVI